MNFVRGARLGIIARGVLALGLIVGIAVSSESLAATPSLVRLLPPVPSVHAAEIGGLSFSESVNEQARPINPTVTFSSETMRIWISFNYYDFKPQDRVKYVIRAHGNDWQSSDVACCVGEEGRYAFPIERERDRAFGGAGYEVVILIGDTEASRGSFVVQGTGGFDNDNCDDETLTQRGNLRSRTEGKC